jgi:hypothetical protein
MIKPTPTPPPVAAVLVRRPAVPAPSDLDRVIRNARREVAARRERVLTYEDLAGRLTQPPMSYTRPGCWTGFVPPALDPDGQPNRSPYRAALVDIAAEAMRRHREPLSRAG